MRPPPVVCTSVVCSDFYYNLLSMGIPGFYRWLTSRFPKICVDAKSKSYDEEQEDKIDATLPNPNLIEVDNLYIGMEEDVVNVVCDSIY